jgi:hypothetical protein
MVHGKRWAYFERRPLEKVQPNPTRGVNFEASINAERNGGNEIDPRPFLKDLRRIRRTKGVAYADFKILEFVPRRNPTWQTLYDLCLRIVKEGNGDLALSRVPQRYQRRAEYIRSHLELVAQIERQKRYSRLKGMPARALLLAKWLAQPSLSLTAAERAVARRRSFRRENRAAHYRKAASQSQDQ